MSIGEFPGNSKKPRPVSESEAPEVIERVVTGEVTSQKKSFGRRFRELFFGGDSRSVFEHVVMDVLVPQAKDMILEAATQGMERAIFGESRSSSRNRYGSRSDASPNRTNYNRYSMRGNNPVGRSDREIRTTPTARIREHDIDEIVLATRVEADEVLDRMFHLLEKYDVVKVADLYSLIGWSSSHVDQKWGWAELAGADVQRTRNGYVLKLPRPLPLD